MEYSEIAFRIGSFPVYWYALFIAAGIIAAVIISDIEAKRRKLFKDLALDLCIVALPSGLIGARIFSCIFSGSFANIFSTSFDGMMLYGAILFGIAGICVYTKIRKFSVLDALDSVTPGILVGIAIARWGDLFNRVGYGPAIEVPWLKWIPVGMYNPQNEVCLSVFFLEFIVCIGIFLFLWLFMRKIRTDKGTVFFTGASLYAFFAFFLEWLRMDNRDVLWILKANQWISLAIVVGLVLLLVITKRMKPLLNSIFHPQRIVDLPEEDDDKNAEPAAEEPLDMSVDDEMTDEPTDASDDEPEIIEEQSNND